MRGLAPESLLGGGTLENFAELISENEIGLVVVDGVLSPVQQRNLERRWQAKVIDRTGLILEIFGARARTHEGRLQVELAALSYQRSRLVRSWTHLERQRGGFGFLGGPGESQLEIDRRLIGERIARLKRELDGVKRTRALHREARRRVPYPVVALVGYTNAGKSTLFNRLTRSSVAADDMLFATLDPTMRRLTLPSGRTASCRTRSASSRTYRPISSSPSAPLSKKSPKPTSSFMSATLITLTASPSAGTCSVCLPISGSGSCRSTGLIEVMNKIDLVDLTTRESLENHALRNSHSVALSAITGEGCEAFLALVDRRLASEVRAVRLDIPLTDGKTLAWVYRHGEVLGRRDDGEAAHLSVRLSEADIARLRHQQRLH